MNQKVLMVDDDQNLLNSIVRRLRNRFQVEIALGPEKALEILSSQGPFAVIVSDLRMPVMDGLQFLSRSKAIAPDSVKILLTGNADLKNAIQAVNEGNIYRFLTKPCPSQVLSVVLRQAVEQYRLITAEKELLEKTLKGSIDLLTELLSLLSPEAFGRSSRTKRYVNDLARHLKVSNPWQIEAAAMLSQIGCVTLSEEVVSRVHRGEPLTDEESSAFARHPRIASDLLSHIPRMEAVAEVIAYQNQRFDGSGNLTCPRKGENIPEGARILKVALDLDALESRGLSSSDALKEMKARTGWYDPAVLKAFEEVLGLQARFVAKQLNIAELKAGMILSEHITTVKGQLILTRGQQVTPVMIERLKSFSRNTTCKEPIQVFVPIKSPHTL